MFVIVVNTTFKPRCDVEHASSSAALYLRTLMNSIAAAAQHNHFGLRHVHFSAREHSSVTTCLSAAATNAMHHRPRMFLLLHCRRFHPARLHHAAPAAAAAAAACCVAAAKHTKAFSDENDTGIDGRKLVRVEYIGKLVSLIKAPEASSEPQKRRDAVLFFVMMGSSSWWR